MFAERLKILRGERKWTQEEVASKLNIARAIYSHYETGRSEPGIVTLVNISNVFNVSLDFLLKGEEFESAQREKMKQIEIMLEKVLDEIKE